MTRLQALTQHVYLRQVLIAQGLLLLVAALMLDLGQNLRACAIGLAAFWIAVLVMTIRCRNHLGPRETAFVNIGWLPIAAVGWWVVLWYWGW